MTFWIVAAILTFVVAFLLLAPLWRSRGTGATSSRGEAAVYRDQLRELDRDRIAGTISAEDADYARAEIGRRLIAASKSSEAGQTATGERRIASQAFICLSLPLIALGVYLVTGTPGLEDQPLAARLANPGNDIELLVAKVETHLAAHPDDGSGWSVVAPIYMRMGRFGDADLAYRNTIRLLGEDAERLKGLGEALVAEAEGVVTDEARGLFAKAKALSPDDPQAGYYLALALEQAGKRDEARAAFETIAKNSPKDAPWLSVIEQHIAKNGGPPVASGATADAGKAPGGPTAADVAAADAMSAGDRDQMIRGMVESLDAKLKEDPYNEAGWTRLIRSYAMLKEPEKAVDALKRGLAAYPPDSREGQALVAEARGLNLPVEDALK